MEMFERNECEDGEKQGCSKFMGQNHIRHQGHDWANVLHPDDAKPTIDA